ncbi:MAG TPA: IPT/TIG domain-containing protein, partial [Candidatus Angelobacter sp.]
MPVTPCRIADTRNPAGPFGGPFLHGQAAGRAFAIPSSACGIPNTAQAYALNMTVVPHGPLGFLTAFPCGQPQPLASNLNSIDGRVKAVAAILPAGTNGAACFFASQDTELVLDINGYFVPDTDATAMSFYPMAPCRLVDTRLAAGPLGGPSLAGNASRNFPLLTSPCNIPATARAYSLNYTAVPKGPLGFLTTWPAGSTQPLVSTLNAITGAVTANAAIVPSGTNGDISVFVTQASDLVIDVNGYFAPPGPGGLSLHNLTPCRVLDTRNPAGSLPFNGAKDLNVSAASCGAPASAQSYVVNATVVPPGPLGFVTLWPQGAAQPLVSTLNAIDGAITSNMAIVPAANGSISIFGSNPTHLVMDISGYFIEPPTGPPPTITQMTPGSAVAGSAAFTMTLTGTNFVPASVVQFNGSTRTTTFTSSTQLQVPITSADVASVGMAHVAVVNPQANGGISAASTFLVGSAGGPGFAVAVVNQRAQRLLYDSLRQVIYAAVPSDPIPNANTISVLDVNTLAITSARPAGVNPNALAISDDGQFLYAGVNGSVQRFTLPALTPDISYGLGSDFLGRPHVALDVQVAPGAPHTTAVTRGSVSFSPSVDGPLTIFDDATPRPVVPSGVRLCDSLEWGTDPATLLCSNTEDSGADLFLLTVDANGVSLKQDVQGAGGSRIRYDQGTNVFYGENGNTVNSSGLPVGNFNTFGTMAPDSSLNKAFFIPFGATAITSYNLRHFTPITTINIPGINGFARNLIRWGQNGLAFTTDSGQIVLVAGNFLDPIAVTPPAPIVVPTPAPTPTPTAQTPTISSLSPSGTIAASPSFTITVNGTNFLNNSVVQFNSTALATTFVSTTQLQAAVPAGQITFAGVAHVVVANPAASGGNSSSSSFLVGTSQINGNTVAVFNQPSNDIVFDPLRQVIYLTVPVTAPNGNSIGVFDLDTGTVIGSQFAGSNVNLLAISDDNQFLYSSLDGAVGVQRFNLSGILPDIEFSVGGDSFIGPHIALDVQPAPGQPHTVAVSTAAEGGISVFDDATPRPTSFSTFVSNLASLQWSPDGTQLFAGGADLVRLAVSPSGVTQNQTFSGLFGSGRRIHFDSATAAIYSDGGRIADPVTGSLLGTFTPPGQSFNFSSPLMVPDSALNAAFSLNGATLNVFNLRQFTAAGSLTVPSLAGGPLRLIRWGQNGLAWNTTGGQLVLLAGPIVGPLPNNPPTPVALPIPAPTPAPTAATPQIALLNPSSAISGGAAFTLTLNGSNFNPAAVVKFNGTSRTTTFISSTQLQAAISVSDIASRGVATITVANPVANGGTSAGSTLFIGTSPGTSTTGAGFAVTVLNQPANDIIFDAPSNVILFSSPSSDAVHGNTISALDLASGSIISSLFAGSEPNVLALSADNQFLYSGIDGAARVQRLNLPAMTKDIGFSLGIDFSGVNTAREVQVAPALPHTVAISKVSSFGSGAVQIFDDSAARPQATFNPSSIQWGSDATTLFSLPGFGGGNLITYTVDANGLTQSQNFPGVFGNGPEIHFDSGTKSIYSDDGHVVDPSTGLPLGNFNTSGFMVTDRTLNKAFFLRQPVAGSVSIDAYVLNRLTAAGSINIPGITGTPKRLIRWGQNGLAFNTTGGQLVLVGGNFLDTASTALPPSPTLPAPTPTPAVNAPVITALNPASASAGGAPFTLTVTGSGFDPAAQVQFNGSSRTTTFISSTQLQAAITSGDIASIGASRVTVVNPVANGGASAAFTFFTGTAQVNGVSIAVLNKASKDIAYDPARQLIYATSANNDANGNSVAVLDLSTASFIGSQFAGSNPNLLALSDDSQFLYAGIDGTSSVQRFTLASLSSPDIRYSVPASIGGGLSTAFDLQVAPGAPHTTAVVPKSLINPSSNEPFSIFDDLTPRASTGLPVSALAWGSDASSLFGTAFSNLLTFSVAPSGPVQTNTFNGVLGFGKIHFNSTTQRVYSEGGQVVNPSTGAPSGIFQSSGPMVSDAATNTAYFASQQTGPTVIKSFDLTHFTPVSSITVPGVTGTVGRLLRWGNNGLAFNTTGGQIVLIGGNLPVAAPFPPATPIPTPAPTPAPTAQTPSIASLSPGSASAGSPAFSITVSGTNFIPASAVKFNGSARTTIFVSATQLTATINASDVASAGTSLITVDNGANGGSSAGSTFFVGTTAGTTPAGASFAVETLAQPANDLLFDPINQVFFVSVPGTSTAHGNTVTALDLSGKVISSQFVGSEPQVLALAGDSSFIYVGNKASVNVQRVALPAMTSDVSYTVGGEFSGPFFPLDIEVAPGAPHTAAVTIGGNGFPAARGGLAIFDDGTERPTLAQGLFNSFDTVQWGADASTLLAATNSTS